MRQSFEVELAPPSINSFYHRSGRGRVYISPKGKEFKVYVEKHLARLMRAGLLHNWKDKKIQTDYRFNFKGKRKRDTSNYIKVIEDCLKGILFTDDEQVWRLTAEKQLNCIDNSIFITIMDYEE